MRTISEISPGTCYETCLPMQDASSNPGWGTEDPYAAVGNLSPHTAMETL